MTEKGKIEKIFSESFQNFEADVDASVWNGIENNLQTPVTIPAQPISEGLSIAAKTIIGLVAASAITISVFYFSQDKKENAAALEKNLSNQLSISTQQPKEILPVLAEEKVGNQNSLIGNRKPEVGNQKTEAISANQINAANNDDKIISNDEQPETQTAISKTIEETKQTDNTAKEKTEPQPQNSLVQPNNTSPSPTFQTPMAHNKPYQPFPFKYNIITPNGDGKNDIYSLETEGLNILSIEAFILDASSSIVYRINNLNGYWDGKDLKGNLAPIGEYRIIVSATGADGTNYKGQKEIILNR